MMSVHRLLFLLNLVMRRGVASQHQHQISGFRRREFSFPSNHPRRSNLYSRISPLGNPQQSVVAELDAWVESGKRVHMPELSILIHNLRKHRRFTHALQVSEWMGGRGGFILMPGDHAVQLDLIGKVRGWAAAESYFDALCEENKNMKTYGALLNCYVRELLVEKALCHMQKMKDLGFVSTALTYNCIMSLYTKSGQHEKVPSMLAEMKEDKVLPDNLSYSICINSYGTRSDLDGMERLLEEMECQPHITVDWNTYALVASIFIKAGIPDKAVIALKKAEWKLLGKRGSEGYNYLISLYSSLGKTMDVLRILKLQKAACRRLYNSDYTNMLGSLMKLEEFEEAEALLKEWAGSGNCYDFRVPNVVLKCYCQKGLVEKAKALLEEITKMGKSPVPDTYGIMAAGYAGRDDLGKAVEFMKLAFSVVPRNEVWKPNPKLVMKILNWFREEENIEEAEAFVVLLSAATGISEEKYHAVIKADAKAEIEFGMIHSRVTVDTTDVDGDAAKTVSSHEDDKYLMSWAGGLIIRMVMKAFDDRD